MKKIIPVLLIFSIIHSSCKKESADLIKLNRYSFSNQIDTSIYSNDTLRLSFGYFGDEEGVSIIVQPENSKSCGFLNKQWEERILQYIPRENFIGNDSIWLVTMKGSDGASSSIVTDTILLVVNVVNENLPDRLTGKWEWIGSCGGFTGGCWYPSENYKSQVEFTSDMNYIKLVNDSITSRFTYHIIDTLKNGENTTYEIGFSNDLITYLWFSFDHLNIQGGDFIEEYKRIE